MTTSDARKRLAEAKATDTANGPQIANLDPATLADRIRSEADLAGRPGQHDRLNALADEVERLARAGETLGGVIDKQCRMILDITGLHAWIDEDGDGDWGAVWENAYELLPRLKAAEAAIERVRALADEERLVSTSELRAALDASDPTEGSEQ